MLLHFERAFPVIMDIFRKWALASGLSLKLPRCSIIMASPGKARYEHFCANYTSASHMPLARAATHLGVVIGPAAHLDQWRAVAAKVNRRLPDVVAAPSVVSRIAAFNIHNASAFQYKSKFCNADGDTIAPYRRAQQRSTKAPWMSISTPVLENVKVPGVPTEVRCLATLALQMQTSVVRRSSVWHGVILRIAAAASFNEPRLDPSCPWHRHSIISTLQRTDVWLNSLPNELRLLADRGDAKRLVEAYRRGDVGRMEAIRPVLFRRGARWFDDAGPRVEGLLCVAHLVICLVHFCAVQPPGREVPAVRRGAWR